MRGSSIEFYVRIFLFDSIQLERIEQNFNTNIWAWHLHYYRLCADERFWCIEQYTDIFTRMQAKAEKWSFNNLICRVQNTTYLHSHCQKNSVTLSYKFSEITAKPLTLWNWIFHNSHTFYIHVHVYVSTWNNKI